MSKTEKNNLEKPAKAENDEKINFEWPSEETWNSYQDYDDIQPKLESSEDHAINADIYQVGTKKHSQD